MYTTVLPVSKDGYLYEKDKDIRNYTPCIILSKKELNRLKRLYKLINEICPCVVFGEILNHPLKLDRDYGPKMKAGYFVLYLYENMSPKIRQAVSLYGGVLEAFVIDFYVMVFAGFILSNCEESASGKEFLNPITQRMLVEIINVIHPFVQMLKMLDRK